LQTRRCLINIPFFSIFLKASAVFGWAGKLNGIEKAANRSFSFFVSRFTDYLKGSICDEGDKKIINKRNNFTGLITE
jgi:hypothetical protein